MRTRTALGEMSCLFLDSAHVLPVKAQKSGCNFRFATIDAGVPDLLGHRKTPRHGAGDAPAAWAGGR